MAEGNGDAARWRTLLVIAGVVTAGMAVCGPVVAVVWQVGSMRTDVALQVAAIQTDVLREITDLERRQTDKFATKEDLAREVSRLLDVWAAGGTRDGKDDH
jgi:ornithine carbamoyltransferase